MADDAESKFDWLPRHTRLRAELILLSVSIYGAAHLKIEPNENTIFPFKLAVVPEGFILSSLSLWWVATLAHFLVRTSVEWNSVLNGYPALSAFDKNEWVAVKRRFEKLEADFQPSTVQSIENHSNVAGLIKQHVDATKTWLNPPPPSYPVDSNRDRAMSILPETLKKIDDSLAKTREEKQRIISEDLPAISAALDKGITRISNELENIHKAKALHKIDRLWIGVWMPLAISFLLVVPSLSEMGQALSESFAGLPDPFFP